MLNKLESFFQTLWVGGLWTVGYIAVPVLFTALDDRQLAGELAGHMLTAINIAGFVCGGALLVGTVVFANGAWLKQRRVQILLVMLITVAIGFFVLHPVMLELKASGLVDGSEEAVLFGRLHGIYSLLYLANSLLGLLLVTMQRRPGNRLA
jgi:hypothetical protein